MMVTFVSQCEKKALNKTRRVLDAFANRIGNRTWQTVITNEGLQAVKKLLRKTASKNTAVSCHWIRSRSRSELVWIVGNRRKFNAEGIVPVNLTDVSKQVEEDFSLNTQVIALLSQLAGLFHDVGKANKLFQDKINPNIETSTFEPYRHEWVSLRIFQAFVATREDAEWINDLVKIDNSTEEGVLNRLEGLRDGVDKLPANPFRTMSPVARTVSWLIVSHHKLPQYPKLPQYLQEAANPPLLENIETWLEEKFEACWTTPQCLRENWNNSIIEANWSFPYGTPFRSAHWQTQVSIVARDILKCNRMFNQDWLQQHYTAHVARLSLMLADHYYSSQKTTSPECQDRNYQAFANTDTDANGNRYQKQKLDEHNIVVGINASGISKLIPNLKAELSPLQENKLFTASVPKKYKEDFGWQDNAYALATSLKEDSKKYGFFGICKASTGKGKTRANARIMYGLADKGQCRFSIALGLRTLTLQTGQALKKGLKLENDELALMIGSQAVKDLHQQSIEAEKSNYQERGSESAEELLKDDITLIESLPFYTGKGKKWFKHDDKILKLIQAPILVSTIDYLMPANEGIRGGRQITPMLRLLTSDLVLDEPDDFGLEDLPALCRLVNWAGMLGSRILLSTATISPSLASALFIAYQEGRKHFTQVNGELGETAQIQCAWFDEFKKPRSKIIGAPDSFVKAHEAFVEKRITKLNEKGLPLRKAKIINVIRQAELKPSEVLARNIQNSILRLHNKNKIPLDEKHISIGLVRMANIKPLVQVTKHLANHPSPKGLIIHYCVYHGQFPLLQRSGIETMLDKALSRQNEKKWIEKSGIPEIMNQDSQKEHIFVVLATSVAEVGRDHDYDWAVVEPSSMRSIIQLAGRIQRHRKQEPRAENIHILSQNYKGLKGLSPCFEKPGFESKKVRYASKHLNELIEKDELAEINAIARIKVPDIVPSDLFTKDDPPRFKSFNALEHFAQQLRLVGSSKEKNHAAKWWEREVTWCGEIQSLQPFRFSPIPNNDYRLIFTRGNKTKWQKKILKTYPAEYQNTSDIVDKPEKVERAEGVVWWNNFDLKKEVERLVRRLDKSEDQIMKRFNHVSLNQQSNESDQQWQYHPVMGIYQLLKNQDKYRDDQ